MKCQDFQELIDSYLCDELLTETNHHVLRHLEHCSGCRSVFEERREFRARLRSTVKNCDDLKICEKFKADLYVRLRESTLTKETKRRVFWAGGFSWAATAAGIVLVAVFGVLMFQNPEPSVSADFAAVTSDRSQSEHFQSIALGDHQNCAVNHNLKEAPVEIDISSPQYAFINSSVLTPLKTELTNCKLIESHICKYDGLTFTHLVFEYEGKTMSVLMTDLNGARPIEADRLAKLSENGYQVAHFDVDNKAVFVVSDLPEQKNSGAAAVLEPPMRKQLSYNSGNTFVSFANFVR